MINKQNLWFITLFSLILVLGIYYVTLADESLKIENVIDKSEPVVTITEGSSLTALEIAEDETTLKEIEGYENILLDENATLEEKNDAYESLQAINDNKITTEKLVNIIKDEFNLTSFVKIKNDQINVTIEGDTHDAVLANNIIRRIQEEFNAQMYITIKFQS